MIRATGQYRSTQTQTKLEHVLSVKLSQKTSAVFYSEYKYLTGISDEVICKLVRSCVGQPPGKPSEKGSFTKYKSRDLFSVFSETQIYC